MSTTHKTQYPKPTPTKRYYVFRSPDRHFPPLESMEYVSRHTRPETTWERCQDLAFKNGKASRSGNEPRYTFYRVHFTSPQRSPEIERYG